MNARQLQAYAVELALQHQNEIAPELMSFIGGDSAEAIDASIRRAKEKSAQIAARVRQTQAPAPFMDNVHEGVSDIDANQVRDMSMPEYARARGRLGIAPPGILDFLGGS